MLGVFLMLMVGDLCYQVRTQDKMLSRSNVPILGHLLEPSGRGNDKRSTTLLDGLDPYLIGRTSAT